MNQPDEGHNMDSSGRRMSAQQQISAFARGDLQGYEDQNNSSGRNGGGGGGGGDSQKVVGQQQQRLFLLQHASKCKIGPACTTKLCAQMKPL